MADSPLVAYCDGLCEPNPTGEMCGGYVVVGNTKVPASVGGAYFGKGYEATNNRAEYEAALLVLRVIYRAGWRGDVLLRGDSQLMVKQYRGEYACNAPRLQALLTKLRHAGTFFSDLTLEWIPRTENEAADEQSRLAYKEVTGRMPPERRKSA